MNKMLVVGMLSAALVACSGSSSTGTPDAGNGYYPPDAGPADPCQGVSGTCVGFKAGVDTEQTISAAVNAAQPNTTLAFGAGTFEFTNTLTIAQQHITLQGAGLDKTILDFKNQTAGNGGITAVDGTSSNIIFQDFTISDTAGDAIKITGADHVTFQRVKVLWTAPDPHTHGAYGLYPVACTNVTIQDSVVWGASDSGIYVGQSNHIIAQRNKIAYNVAGLEIENSYDADVHDNDSEGNTAGILIFALPGLQQEGGYNIRVYNNTIISNNADNFAATGDIVGIVPAGTGFFVMANHDVEVFGNTIQGNNDGAASVISYYVSQLPINDANYYPFPQRIYIHDNTITGNGREPDQNSQIGALLNTVRSSFADGNIPGLAYDGIVDPTATGGTPTNPMQICFSNNGDTGFLDLNFGQLNADGSNFASIISQDITPYTCQLPALPAVSF
jgi:parallel beta-helix repeat protein